MIRNENKVYALFDAIGELDPKLTEDALKYRRTGVRKRQAFVVLLAACIALSLMLTVGVGVMIGDKSGSGDAALPDAGHPVEDGNAPTLEEMLATSTSHRRTDPSKLDLFNGKSALIWQNEGDNYYCVVNISEDACDRLLKIMSESEGEKIDRDENSVSVRVWIACGDGSVVSPYLTSSKGNTGYGSLFEYDPEIEPDENFISQIKKLIG